MPSAYRRLKMEAVIQKLNNFDLEARIFLDNGKQSGNERVEIKAVFECDDLGGPVYLLYGLYAGKQMASFQRERMREGRTIRFFELRAFLRPEGQTCPAALKLVANALRAVMLVEALGQEFERLRKLVPNL
jgi:hypothetical protein